MTAPVIRDYLKVVAGGSAGAADADLVARFAASRDEAAFELLVWRHAALVQRVCRSVLHDHHAAEDAAQATFLALARKSPSFARRGSVVGWLYRVGRRVAVRLARQRARMPRGAGDLDRVPAPESNESTDSLNEILAEVARLPERYRVPVLLCFFEGLTHGDAARRLGWPVGTVSSRLGRAKELLARRLSRRGLGVPTVALPLASAAFVSQTARAATVFVAGGQAVRLIPPTVLSLARGATMSSTFVKLSAVAAVLCAVTAGVWGLSPAHQTPGSGGAPGSGPGGVGAPKAGDAGGRAAAPDDAKTARPGVPPDEPKSKSSGDDPFHPREVAAGMFEKWQKGAERKLTHLESALAGYRYTRVEYAEKVFWVADAHYGDGVPYKSLAVYAPAKDGSFMRVLLADSNQAGWLAATVDPKSGVLELRERANSELKGEVVLSCNLKTVGTAHSTGVTR